jgi:hypothetical protein
MEEASRFCESQRRVSIVNIGTSVVSPQSGGTNRLRYKSERIKKNLGEENWDVR